MSSVRVVLNSKGIREFLLAPETAAVLAEQASAIAQRCGDGYETDAHNTAGRAVASVYTASDAAKRDNLDNNTILRSLST